MYTLRQNALFTDEIELQKNDGTSEILKIKIDIRPELVKKYRELQVRFVDLQKRSNSNPGDLKIVEDIGKVVVDVFCLLFGDENAKKSLNFIPMIFSRWPTIFSRMFKTFSYLNFKRLPVKENKHLSGERGNETVFPSEKRVKYKLVPVRLNTSFRTVLKCYQVFSDTLLTDFEKAEACLWLLVKSKLFLKILKPDKKRLFLI